MAETAGRNPLLTVIVPVHGVEAYLRQCLDSILADDSALEVVAVDDASPDGCPAILDAYAAADPRMRVTHLRANVGLGQARNAGLRQARGEYVWFVDGDDWLPAGAIPAVLAALRSGRPDVLLIDHRRIRDPGGEPETDPSNAVLRGLAGTSPLAERPRLLDMTQAAWNRIVRWDLLRKHELGFFPGWYEDVPFSSLVLLASGGIDVLDRVCYHYRQRAGAITSTVSARHVEVFGQYEQLFAGVDRLGAAGDEFRPRLFRRMIDHYLVIAGNESRLPTGIRRAFVHRAAAHYRRYLPPGGYPRPGGMAGLKHRMLRADAYLAYATTRRAYRLFGRIGNAPAPRRPRPEEAGAR